MPMGRIVGRGRGVCIQMVHGRRRQRFVGDERAGRNRRGEGDPENPWSSC